MVLLHSLLIKEVLLLIRKLWQRSRTTLERPRLQKWWFISFQISELVQWLCSTKFSETQAPSNWGSPSLARASHSRPKTAAPGGRSKEGAPSPQRTLPGIHTHHFHLHPTSQHSVPWPLGNRIFSKQGFYYYGKRGEQILGDHWPLCHISQTSFQCR